MLNYDISIGRKRRVRQAVGHVLAVGIVAAAAFVVDVDAASPALAACDGPISYRAGDSSNSTAAYTVYGKIHTPGQGSISGYGVDRPSAGDVYLAGDSNNFVQAGWYVGSTSGNTGNLPYTATPRMFYGENVGSNGDEDLKAGPVLGWSSAHIIRISYAVNGIYYFYLSGTYEGESSHSHSSFMGVAAFNGEVDNSCTDMRALAYAGTDASTLTWNDTNGTHHLFADHNYHDPGYSSFQYGGVQATDEAY